MLKNVTIKKKGHDKKILKGKKEDATQEGGSVSGLPTAIKVDSCFCFYYGDAMIFFPPHYWWDSFSFLSPLLFQFHGNGLCMLCEVLIK